jgi:predicted AAA+ superfamily ATPase
MLGSRNAYFWATHAGAELDLLVMMHGKRHGFEFKYADAPGRTRSMLVAIQDLQLDRLWVVYPGDQEYTLDDKISVLPANSLPHLKELLQQNSG